MTPQKRPYTPKTKGCFQCSRRRVNCDRAEPVCRKCSDRGLDCSGLGVRHRFEVGIASRGKWVGRADMQAIYEDEADGVLVQRAKKRNNARQKTVKTKSIENEPPKALHDNPDNGEADKQPIPSSSEHSIHRIDGESAGNQTSTSAQPEGIQDLTDVELLQREQTPDEELYRMAWEYWACAIPQIVSSTLPPWMDHMCLHFSNHICFEMVAVDGPYNSWRNLILPFAQTDELVMNAIQSVAVYHYVDSHFPDGLQTPAYLTGLPDPNDLHGRVIRGLQRHRDLDSCDVSTQHSVLLTILVLIVGAMVAEGSDFPYLFRILESALTAIGGEETLGSCEVSAFVIAQANKLRVYSAPLLDEAAGLQTISSPTRAAELLKSLSHRLSHYPEHAVVLSFVTDLVRQAFDIYLEQFNAPDPENISQYEMTRSITRVQHFKETLEAFPEGSPGEQVLVWASFVAASGCLLVEHMNFFEGVFLRHYARNGFGNIRRSLEYLRKIWARDPGRRWTSVMADAKFLVM